MGESHIDHRLAGILTGIEGATLHFRTSNPVNHVKLVVRRDDRGRGARGPGEGRRRAAQADRPRHLRHRRRDLPVGGRQVAAGAGGDAGDRRVVHRRAGGRAGHVGVGRERLLPRQRRRLRRRGEDRRARRQARDHRRLRRGQRADRARDGGGGEAGLRFDGGGGDHRHRRPGGGRARQAGRAPSASRCAGRGRRARRPSCSRAAASACAWPPPTTRWIWRGATSTRASDDGRSRAQLRRGAAARGDSGATSSRRRRSWRASCPDVKWSRKVENLHVTLKFLGQVDEERLAALGTALGAALGAAAALSGRAARAWARFRRRGTPASLWAGVDDVEQRARARWRRRSRRPASASASRASSGPFDRPRDGRPLEAAAASTRAPRSTRSRTVTFGGTTVEEVHVYESRLGGEGSTYVLRSRAALASN